MARMADLHSVATDIKTTLTSAIADLCTDLHHLNKRIQVVEETSSHHDAALMALRHTSSTHKARLLEMHRHIEDLVNRGRRHNIRVRGLPEAVEADQLEHTLLHVFNGLLDRPPESPIVLERFHRALCP